jgi:hypothetical protein
MVALYLASASIVESAAAEQQDDEKDDDESVCVHCGAIVSGRGCSGCPVLNAVETVESVKYHGLSEQPTSLFRDASFASLVSMASKPVTAPTVSRCLCPTC